MCLSSIREVWNCNMHSLGFAITKCRSLLSASFTSCRKSKLGRGRRLIVVVQMHEPEYERVCKGEVSKKQVAHCYDVFQVYSSKIQTE